MKTAGKLAFLVVAWLGLAGVAHAVPVGFSLEGIVGNAPLGSTDLEGAEVTVTYTADTNQAPFTTGVNNLFPLTFANFVWDVSLHVTGRPNGAADILETSTTNGGVRNYHGGATNNDAVSFFGGLSFASGIQIGNTTFEFDSPDFLSGSGVYGLDALLLPGTVTNNELRLGFGGNFGNTALIDTTVTRIGLTSVSEPQTMILALFSLLGLLAIRRR